MADRMMGLFTYVGVGVVVACSRAENDHEVTVNFEEAGVKKLLLSLAPLEKV